MTNEQQLRESIQELLAACKRLVECIHDESNPGGTSFIDRVHSRQAAEAVGREAIRNAEGKL